MKSEYFSFYMLMTMLGYCVAQMSFRLGDVYDYTAMPMYILSIFFMILAVAGPKDVEVKFEIKKVEK